MTDNDSGFAGFHADDKLTVQDMRRFQVWLATKADACRVNLDEERRINPASVVGGVLKHQVDACRTVSAMLSAAISEAEGGNHEMSN